MNIRDKKVLIRVDYNVPIENGEIQNDFRIKKSLETIKYCLEKNCSIVLISHLGRPNGKYNENTDPPFSLLSISINPLCKSIIFLQIANPIPVPGYLSLGFNRLKGLKI